MSSQITNRAIISFNGTEITTCPVATYVEPTLTISKRAFTTSDGVITSTGVVGSDRTVVYDLLLVNHSSIPFTNIVIEDTVSLSDASYTKQSFTYDTANSTYPNEATASDINKIKLTIPSLAPESTLQLHYTLIFNDDVAIGTNISNQAQADYAENPNIDNESGEHIPVPSNVIVVRVNYNDTSISATKSAPSTVLCGQEYAYEMNFTNTGSQVAFNITIEDTLPSNYTPNLDKLTIVNDGTPLTNTDYSAEYNSTSHLLTISETEVDGVTTENLNIQPGKTLVVTLYGTATCN